MVADELAMTMRQVSTRGMMLMGYQRTKQISRKARLAWEAGQPEVLEAEIAARREAVFAGVLAEVYAEYLPLRAALLGFAPSHVIDIGCGAGVNDLFLARDYGCGFTLVDIEETRLQYHLWSHEGSGYAALSDARALLEENGTAPERINCLNPRLTPERMAALEAGFARGEGAGDALGKGLGEPSGNALGKTLLTSLFSCGFHYPIGAYLGLMQAVIARGGTVALDLRNRYLNAPDPALTQLLAGTQHRVALEMEKSKRFVFTA